MICRGEFMDRLVLVVEDERAIADIIVYNLKKEGYDAIEANDGQTGLDLALERNPDLILLDVMLPVMDGFEICRRVRQVSDVPIIILTAREEETNIVLGLETGADDYMTKPFSMRELLARVKANMRRNTRAEYNDKGVRNEPVKIPSNRLIFDPERHEITKGGSVINLTVREYELLSFLIDEPGKVISREELMKKVWGYDYYGDLRAVDVAVRRLREKIEDNPAEPLYLMTKRGFGYYFNRGV